MSDSVTIDLSHLPNGWYMKWDMYTQAAREITVTLRDSDTAHTYVDRKSRQSMELGAVAQGHAYILGEKLELRIDIPGATLDVDSYSESYFTLGRPGNIVGHGYAIALEDAKDDDFNDLYATIVAWKSKG